MEKTNADTKNSPISYEELKKLATQLYQRAYNAETRLQVVNMTDMRLKYLFNVLDRKNFFPEEFVNDCRNEIIDILRITDEEEGKDTPTVSEE